MRYILRLLEDIVPETAEPIYLPGIARMIFVRSGGITLETGDANQYHAGGSAWIGQQELTYLAGSEASELLRWEVVPIGELHDGRLRSAPKTKSRVLNESEIELDPANSWLLRCDQVTFPAGTVAPTHMHQGPGLRFVLRGEIDGIGPGGVRKMHQPGDTFLENGIDEPVSATMHAGEETSFLRGLILPRAVKGRPSTRFVNREDWKRSKRQTYHIHTERHFELP